MALDITITMVDKLFLFPYSSSPKQKHISHAAIKLYPAPDVKVLFR